MSTFARLLTYLVITAKQSSADLASPGHRSRPDAIRIARRPTQGRPTMATTKRGLDDGHAPGSKRRAPDPYEYERICDLPDALDCFADPRARSTPNGSAISPHPSSAIPCKLGGHEPSRSHWQARRRRPRRAASCATGVPQTSTRQQSPSCCRRQRPSQPSPQP